MSLQGLQIAGQALRAHQRSLEITGQNIANAGTVGYSRQVAVLAPVESARPSGTVGAGVDVVGALRSHAGWLDRSADSLRGQAGDAQIAQDLAGRIEALTGEPGDTGIQSALDRFSQAFQALADRPDDLSLKGGAVRAAGALLDRFSQALGGLDGLKQETLAAAGVDVAQVNALAKQAAGLNAKIAAAQASGQPANALLDQRDQILETLTRQTGATVSGRDGGALVVTIGGVTLVQGDHATELHLDGGALSTADGVPVSAGGALGARLGAVQSGIPALATRLAGVRDTLVAQVNPLVTGGKDTTGAPGAPLFVVGADGAPAVNPDLRTSPGRLAVGGGAAGDGSVARAVAALADQPEVSGAYRSLVGEIAAGAADSAQRSAIADASLQQLQTIQSSESGVNLDEELASLVAEQHVYAASARLLSTYDQMLETLIQRTG